MSIVHQIGLTLIPGVGHVTARNLLNHFGKAEDVFTATHQELLAIPGIGQVTAGQIRSSKVLLEAEKQWKELEKKKVEYLFIQDEKYPRRLRECSDAPLLLYYKGTANLNHPRIVSVVGTRMATEYGRQLCRMFIETLRDYDVLVVSGLAYGIDVAAHKECLRNQVETVGVLGHGLDRIYPYHHKQVAADMLQHGGLLTEFPLHTLPDRENFPKRNRIIAGMADVTLVIEATVKGGALITADLANSYNRDVFAFPGRIYDECSQGCNFLIKTNRAALITKPADLVEAMGWDLAVPQTDGQLEMPLGLTPDELTIVKILREAPAVVDELSSKANMPQSKLAVHLLNLEMQGIIGAAPGKIYKLNSYLS